MLFSLSFRISFPPSSFFHFFFWFALNSHNHVLFYIPNRVLLLFFFFLCKKMVSDIGHLSVLMQPRKSRSILPVVPSTSSCIVFRPDALFTLLRMAHKDSTFGSICRVVSLFPIQYVLTISPQVLNANICWFFLSSLSGF